MGDWAQKYRNTSDFTLKEEGAENLICSLHQALSYYMIKAVTIFSGSSGSNLQLHCATLHYLNKTMGFSRSVCVKYYSDTELQFGFSANCFSYFFI